jgi:sterol 24-C-methyltransferase
MNRTLKYLSRTQQHLAARRHAYQEITNEYYDIATQFYERAWGQSFHFAPRWRGESLRESLLRHEYWLALQLGLEPGMRVLDVGCGVGGPMRNIARFSGANVIGINNNAYQVSRLAELNAVYRMEGCRALQGDFMAMPFSDCSMDAAYAIEATVHAPDLAQCYREVLRVLRPEGPFATYEWCMTQKYDAADDLHNRLKRCIEIGNGIVNIGTTVDAVRAAGEAGFELLHCEDLIHDRQGRDGEQVQWWEPLAPARLSIASIRSSPLGARVTSTALRLLETLRVAPRGACTTAKTLEAGAKALVAAARLGIFTPAFFILAKRPRRGSDDVGS